MNTVGYFLQNSVEQLREILMGLKPKRKLAVRMEQLEFGFGLTKENDFEQQRGRKNAA